MKMIYLSIIVISSLTLLPSGLGGFMGYYYVVSGSMGLNAPIGSLIITVPEWLKKPVIGDIVVYEGESLGLISHRVVGVDGEYYIVASDVGGYVERVWHGRVIGVAVVVIPLMGFISMVGRLNPLTFTVLIVFLALSIIPSGKGSKTIYYSSIFLSILPSLLPVRLELQFLRNLTGAFYSSLFLLGSVLSYISRLEEATPEWFSEAASILVSIASVSVVEIPW